MTIIGLHDEYRDLYVTLTNGQTLFGIDVHEYRNHELAGEFSTAAGVTEYDRLRKIIEKRCQRVAKGKYRFVEAQKTTESNGWSRTVYEGQILTTWPDLMRPFIGKGTPDDIRWAIRLAVHYDLLEASVSSIQKYCDANIGIDCSGFASAYYGGNWMGKGATHFRDNAPKITRIEDIKPGDAIVWQSGVHIALIDKIVEVHREGSLVYALTCMAAESTANRMLAGGPSDGLNYSEYCILFERPGKVGPGNFKALRSLVQKGQDSSYQVNIFVVRPA
jgi:hypothetical protein